MESKKENTVAVLLAWAVAITAVVMFAQILYKTGSPSFGGNTSGNRPETAFGFMNFATSGRSTLTAGVSSLVLATSSTRAYARFSTECSNVIYLRVNMSSTSASVTPDAQYVPAQGGIEISSTTPYEFKHENRYTGAVYASSSKGCSLNVNAVNY